MVPKHSPVVTPAAVLYYGCVGSCFRCGAEIDGQNGVFRSTVCPGCGADARVCKNCVFYSPGKHWDCAETIPEEVRDKERANFCDYFRLSARAGAATDFQSKQEEARSSFDSLFGGEPGD
jgi:hypothetical protein